MCLQELSQLAVNLDRFGRAGEEEVPGVRDASYALRSATIPATLSWRRVRTGIVPGTLPANPVRKNATNLTQGDTHDT